MNAIQRLDVWIDSWPERLAARDDAFVARLAGEVAALDALDYDRRETLDALGMRLYVRAWASCPRWLESVEKLPSPLKWRDGLTVKPVKQMRVRAIRYRDVMFVAYADNTLVGMRWDARTVLAIHEIHLRTLPELVDGLPNGPAIERQLTEIARTYGLRMTNNRSHFMRPMKGIEPKEART